MTLKTRPVGIKLTTAAGAPAANAQVTIDLTLLSVVEEEIVVLKTINATADSNGELVPRLVPNELTENGSQYVITARRGGEILMAETYFTLPDGPDDEEVPLTSIINAVPFAPLPNSTDQLAEGAINKYFTAGRVLSTVLAGFSAATGGIVTAADTVLAALGKLQHQVSNIGGGAWGTITGTLINQTDLQTALDAKADDSDLAGYVPTTRTVNAQALSGNITLTAADVGAPDGSGTSSGANTGDETGARIATLLHAASAKTTLVDGDEVNGTDSAASYGLIRTTWANVWTYINSKAAAVYQAVLVSGTNIKTVNGTTLLGSGDVSVTTSPGGSSNQVQYNNAGAFAGSSGLTFQATGSPGGGPLLTVGASDGWKMGSIGGNSAGIWAGDTASPTTSNAAVSYSSDGQFVNLNSTATTRLTVNSTTKLSVTSTAGTGADISGGTATTAVNAVNASQTVNAAVSTILYRGVLTEGASGSANTSKLMSLLYGTSGSETERFSIDKTGAVTTSARLNLASCTVATLPAAGAASGVIYVSDAGGNGPCLAISNGTNWKRCDNTGTTVT